MAEREIVAKDAIEQAIIDMRRADANNSGVNCEDVTPFFIAYLKAKIEHGTTTYTEDLEILKPMIAEIEAINPQMWTNGKPMEKV